MTKFESFKAYLKDKVAISSNNLEAATDDEVKAYYEGTTDTFEDILDAFTHMFKDELKEVFPKRQT